MEIFKRQTHIDFIGNLRIPVSLSVLLNILTLIALFMFGLNLGLDFTGGTLVEVSYAQPVKANEARKILAEQGMSDAVVQHFGTARDLMIRLPVRDTEGSAAASGKVVETLRSAVNERVVESRPGQAQQCVTGESPKWVTCHVQVRRIEFVGPQVGKELVEKGGLALLFTIIGVLVYVIFRFEWRFAVGAIVAISHDVFLVFGFFSVTQMDFSLSVLAAILAVLGYSLNDTIVVFDRVRENFRKMRKSNVIEIMNASVNQTLSRTVITSGTTLLTLFALFFYGGEIIHGFSVAMIVGVVIGTYSSIFIAIPVTLALGITREDMLPVKKEAVQDNQP